MKKVFFICCSTCSAAYILHYMYAFFNSNTPTIINIEHSFYILLALLSAISMLNIFKGKTLLYFLCIMCLSCLYGLPEFEEITALESCYDGQCEPAENMGIVKIDNGKINYISAKDR